ncbi:MAG: protein kinase, partial [Myxococcales bacterium]|nr:protein kinase [Myxococcales bacterium]
AAPEPAAPPDVREPEPEPPPRHLTLLPGTTGERTGEVLRGRYELLGVLGQGGMATVYEARFLPSDRRHVAVKILRRRLSGKPESARRFAREFRILDSIDHPALVKVRDLERADDGRLFMVMELLRGQSLDKLRAPLSPARAITIGLQLCDVLAALHAAGVIHRDLKPSNVILLHGTGDRVKLVDLGVARLEAAWYIDDRPYLTPPEARSLTRAGFVLGTPRYVPPEAGDAPPTLLWDIYALGVMLWQLLTLRPPPASWREVGVMDDVAEGRFGIPKLLERALRKAMAVEPSRRFQSAGELREELEVAAADLDVEDNVVEAAPNASANADKSQVPQRPQRDNASPANDDDVTRSPSSKSRFQWLVVTVACFLSAALGATVVAFVQPAARLANAPSPPPEATPAASSALPTTPTAAPPEAIAPRIATCIVDDLPEHATIDLRLDARGELESIDAGPELDPLMLSCISSELAGIQLSEPGVPSTQTLDLAALRPNRGQHDAR